MLLAPLALLCLATTLFVAGSAAAAQEPVVDDPGFVVIVEVSGLLDPVLANFIEQAITDAERADAVALVLQVNSGRAVVDEERIVELARRVRDADVPVTAWVGPAGAKARGEIAQVLSQVDDLGISPGSRIGDLGEIVLPADEFGVPFGDAGPGLVNDTTGYDEAEQIGVARQAPVLINFLAPLDGFRLDEQIDDDGETTLVPLTQARFGRLSLLDQLFHTMASPEVAYLLFLTGLALLVFELFTAGVGVAGVVGAGAFIGGCYGLDVLPARWWAVALLVFSMFGFAVDIQTGVPRVWTGIALVSLLLGSVLLYDGVSMSWISLVVGLVGVSVGMVSGMPSMVRTRFSTPTIGREWMIGDEGEVVDDVAPEGVVRVRDALWRARTNRATPVAKGDAVRVIAIEGLVLEVEPETGGARDYRERR